MDSQFQIVAPVRRPLWLRLQVTHHSQDPRVTSCSTLAGVMDLILYLSARQSARSVRFRSTAMRIAR